jgi:hypothetical protein
MSYTKPELRERLKNQIKAGSKGGKPGQWSAVKALLLAKEYKKRWSGQNWMTRQEYEKKNK